MRILFDFSLIVLVLISQILFFIDASKNNVISSLPREIQRFLRFNTNNDNQKSLLRRRLFVDDDDDAPQENDDEEPEGDDDEPEEGNDDEPADDGDDEEPEEDDDDCGAAATFQVNGNDVIMNGEIVAGTENRLFSLLETNTQVDTLVLQNVPGSCDDAAMFKLGIRVHHAGLKTVLPSGGYVASGGSDLLLAGTTRTVNANACIGVHSWCCDDRTNHVASLPTADGVHQPYIDYYKAVGYTAAEAANLYWFTITVAPSEGMHYVTRKEITKLKNFDFGQNFSECNRSDEGMDDTTFDFTIPPTITRALGLPLSSEQPPVPMPVEDPETASPVSSPEFAPVEDPKDEGDDDEPSDDEGDFWDRK